MGAVASRSMLFDIFVRMKAFDRRSASVSFRRLWGNNASQGFTQRLSVVLHDWHIDLALASNMLCEKAFLMLLHAFLLRGLRPTRFPFLLLISFYCFLVVTLVLINSNPGRESLRRNESTRNRV
jgi:hypothetical protein